MCVMGNQPYVLSLLLATCPRCLCIAAIFQAVGSDSSGGYTGAEAGEVAFAYAKQQQLDVQGPDGRTLLLDATLCDAL